MRSRARRWPRRAAPRAAAASRSARGPVRGPRPAPGRARRAPAHATSGPHITAASSPSLSTLRTSSQPAVAGFRRSSPRFGLRWESLGRAAFVVGFSPTWPTPATTAAPVPTATSGAPRASIIVVADLPTRPRETACDEAVNSVAVSRWSTSMAVGVNTRRPSAMAARPAATPISALRATWPSLRAFCRRWGVAFSVLPSDWPTAAPSRHPAEGVVTGGRAAGPWPGATCATRDPWVRGVPRHTPRAT